VKLESKMALITIASLTVPMNVAQRHGAGIKADDHVVESLSSFHESDQPAPPPGLWMASLSRSMPTEVPYLTPPSSRPPSRRDRLGTS
jgi:hypothetical protein